MGRPRRACPAAFRRGAPATALAALLSCARSTPAEYLAPDGPFRLDAGPAETAEAPSFQIVCGNGRCEGIGANETCFTCPEDCAACPYGGVCPGCGNGVCEVGTHMDEDCRNCPADCGRCPVWCGDMDCQEERGETCDTCPRDCGPCPFCGDLACDPGAGENCKTCPRDCPQVCPSCGNLRCESPACCEGDPETCESCPGDCGACPVCGDGRCTSFVSGDFVIVETCETCEQDCGPGRCGDGLCNGPSTCFETADNCPRDCAAPGPVCGDGVCSCMLGEDEIRCSDDCKPPE